MLRHPVMAEHHTILGGKVHVYRRDGTPYWQCSTYLAGKNRRTTTKEKGLSKAKDFAEDWFLELRGKSRSGELRNEKTFNSAADQYLREYDVITEGTRSPVYVEGNHNRLRVHLRPFFGSMGLSEITAGTVQEYRVHRHGVATKLRGRPPASSTMHQEIVTLRQTLKTALRHGWLNHLPDLSAPYKTNGKISHRARFSNEEYKKLYAATRRRVANPKNNRYRWEAEQLHDYVLFLANTGLRPDEARQLQFRDVAVVHDDATNETILEIEVRGKRGVGFCKSTTGAVRPFERLKSRNASRKASEGLVAQPSDVIFPKTHRELFNAILREEDLKHDREGQPRTAYSLRHTYICLRLIEGGDIYQIAKNCRTSVEMIEKYYASHITNRLDAAAINVRRRKQKPPSSKSQ